jgi:hypothetical protein
LKDGTYRGQSVHRSGIPPKMEEKSRATG